MYSFQIFDPPKGELEIRTWVQIFIGGEGRIEPRIEILWNKVNDLWNKESSLPGCIIYFTLVNYRSSILLTTLENFSKWLPEMTS